jgi:hypothetical protein
VMDIANPSNQYVSMTDPLRVEDQTGRYHTETFFIPPIKPGGTFRIALTLKPLQDPKAWMDLLPGPDDSPFIGQYFEKLQAAHDALDAWRALYRTNDLVLKVSVGPYEAFTVPLPAKN